MARKAHRKFIAEWIKDTKTPEEAKEILSKKKTIFDENVFSFDKEVDDLLELAAAGDSSAFKDLFEVLGDGTGEFLKEPGNDIFYPEDYDNEFIRGHIDHDKLENYHESHNEPYLGRFNILTVYESGYGGMTTAAFPVYIIDYDNRVIHQLEYEESHEGDEQYLSMMDEYVPF